MRSPGAIFRKLKDAKFRHLVVLYKQYLKRAPENCKYNYKYPLLDYNGDSHYLGLCMLHQEDLDLKNGVYPHLLEICQASEDCQNCNAFVNRYTQEDVKEIFDQELNDKRVKVRRYPDICALEWVLERSAVGIQQDSWILRLFKKLKRGRNP